MFDYTGLELCPPKTLTFVSIRFIIPLLRCFCTNFRDIPRNIHYVESLLRLWEFKPKLPHLLVMFYELLVLLFSCVPRYQVSVLQSVSEYPTL